jgi:hypothetical protein
MSGRRRPLAVSSTRSVLDEMFSNGPEDQSSTTTPVAPVADSQATQVSNASDASSTRVQHGTDTDPPVVRKPGNTNRTPAGKTRYTAYISADVAKQVDAAADKLVAALGGLVPKHRALDALLLAGVGQSAAVAARLRADLLAGLENDNT